MYGEKTKEVVMDINDIDAMADKLLVKRGISVLLIVFAMTSKHTFLTTL